MAKFLAVWVQRRLQTQPERNVVINGTVLQIWPFGG